MKDFSSNSEVYHLFEILRYVVCLFSLSKTGPCCKMATDHHYHYYCFSLYHNSLVLIIQVLKCYQFPHKSTHPSNVLSSIHLMGYICPTKKSYFQRSKAALHSHCYRWRTMMNYIILITEWYNCKFFFWRIVIIYLHFDVWWQKFTLAIISNYSINLVANMLV